MNYLEGNILLNVVLGVIGGVFSLLYWKKVGGTLPIITAIVLLYMAGLQLYLQVHPSPDIEAVRQLSYFVRPGITAMLIIFAYKAVSAYKRVR